MTGLQVLKSNKKAPGVRLGAKSVKELPFDINT